jgi:hypothetical protein
MWEEEGRIDLTVTEGGGRGSPSRRTRSSCAICITVVRLDHARQRIAAGTPFDSVAAEISSTAGLGAGRLLLRLNHQPSGSSPPSPRRRGQHGGGPGGPRAPGDRRTAKARGSRPALERDKVREDILMRRAGRNASTPPPPTAAPPVRDGRRRARHRARGPEASARGSKTAPRTAHRREPPQTDSRPARHEAAPSRSRLSAEPGAEARPSTQRLTPNGALSDVHEMFMLRGFSGEAPLHDQDAEWQPGESEVESWRDRLYREVVPRSRTYREEWEARLLRDPSDEFGRRSASAPMQDDAGVRGSSEMADRGCQVDCLSASIQAIWHSWPRSRRAAARPMPVGGGAHHAARRGGHVEVDGHTVFVPTT